MAEDYGAKINKKRSELKLSIEKLALNAKVSKDTISRLEAGEPGVSIGKLQRVLSALDLKVGDVFDASKLDEKSEQFVTKLEEMNTEERQDYIDLFTGMMNILEKKDKRKTSN